MPANAERLQFCGFELDLTSPSLTRAGKAVGIRDQTLRLLCALARAEGQVVPRSELAQSLWGSADIDYDQRLNAAVRDLRKVLGDDVKAPRMVRTHPRKGYSFAATARPARRRGQWIGVAAAALAVAGGAARWFGPPASDAPDLAPGQDQYIEARALIDSFDPAHSERAERMLRDAISLAPGESVRWSALASLMCRKPIAPEDKYPAALDAAGRALALDPRNVEARLRLADVAMTWQRDWPLAREHLEAALREAPGDAMVHHAIASLHYLKGEFAAGEAALQDGLLIDPLSTVLHTDLAWYYTASGHFEKAIEQCSLLARIHSQDAPAAQCALLPTLLLGRTEDAASLAGSALRTAGLKDLEGLADAELLRLYWQRSLAAATDAAATRYVDPVLFAQLHAQLGDPANTMNALERAISSRSTFAPYIHLFPEFRGLHSRPAFVALVEQLGLAEDPKRFLAQLDPYPGAAKATD